MITLEFSLPAYPPFRLDLTVWVLRRRSKNIIDSWDGVRYVRIFSFGDNPIKVSVFQKGREPQIAVIASSFHPIPAIQEMLTQLLNRILGLEINLDSFYQFAKKDERLSPLVKQFIGLKPPCFSNIFESLTNAIACQQVSLESGLTSLNRLVQQYGCSFQEGEKVYYSFPEASTIMHCNTVNLRTLGFSQRKSEALINLALAITSQKDTYSKLEQKSDKDIVEILSNLKGIGRWSIEYAMLRGLGRIEILPGDDVGFQKNLKQLFALDKMPNYNDIQELSQNWYPYAGLVYFHLLLKKLEEKGLIMNGDSS